jgi:hypothetical protein
MIPAGVIANVLERLKKLVIRLINVSIAELISL